MMKNILNLILCSAILILAGQNLKAYSGDEDNFCFDADVPEAQDNLSAICLTAPVLFCPPTYLGCPSDNLDPQATGFPTALPGDADCPTPVVTFTDDVTTNTACLKIIHRTWEATYPPGSASIKLHSTCQQTLYLEDDGLPSVVDCPSDIVIDLSIDCDSTAIWVVPTAKDECGIQLFTTTHFSGAQFSTGTTAVTYTAQDFCGNQSFCNFNVTVQGSCCTTPAIICPAVYTTCPISGDISPATAGSATATASNASCGDPVITYTDSFASNGTCAGAGTTTRTWVAEDPSDSSYNTSCTQTITVIDNTNPIISDIPGTINISGNGSNCGVVVTWSEPNATDDCGMATWTSSHTSGTSFAEGTTAVSYTATDECGNTTIATFDVNVVCVCDAAPVLTCAANFTGCPGLGTDPSVTGLSTAVAGDNNCGVPALNYTDVIISSGPCAGASMIERTWTATVSNNNALLTSCTQLITLEDASSPTLTNLPQDITVSGTGTNCAVPVTWNVPTATDNCGVASLTSSHNNGASFSTGTTTVTYTALDNCGLSTSQSFSITVNCQCDENPIITCPADFEACTTDGSEPSVTGTATAIAGGTNCGTPIVTYIDNIISSGPCNGAVELQRTWTAIDPNGSQLTASCVQNILLTDNEIPTLTNIPSDLTVHGSGTGCSVPVKWSNPTVTDDCAVTLTSNYDNGHSFDEGTTSVLFIATDGCGNTAMGSFNVTVACAAGCQNPPSITCPSDYAVCPGGFLPSPSVAGLAVATPSSTVCSTPFVFYSDQITGFGNCGGSYTAIRTWTAFDLGTGLTGTCVQNINLIDNTLPTITNIPQDINLTADASTCTAQATWTLPIANDDCGIASLVSDYNTGEAFADGTTTVTYTATDNCNNISTATFNVNVTCVGCDSNPTIACPANYTTCPLSGAPSPSLAGTATASAGSSLCATPTISYIDAFVSTGACANSGIYNRTWIAVDPSDTNLSASCVQVLTLEDNNLPVISNVPSDIVLEGSGSSCEAVVTWTAPTVTDACGQATLTSTHTSGLTLTQGTTTVTYTATDACGQTVTSSFNVTVNCATCVTPPSITCPANYSACADGTVPGLNVTGYAFGIINGTNCTGVPYTTFTDVIISSGTCATSQVIERTWTSTDPNNKLASSCVQTISLIDDEAPIITNIPSDIVLNGDGFGCQVQGTWAEPTASDNCGMASLSYNIGSGMTFSSGTTSIIYTATDNCGNVSTASFTVTVQCALCTTPPSITCPSNLTTCITANIDPSTIGSATAAITGANCSGAPYISYVDNMISTGSCTGSGVIDRYWMAVDPTNNLSNSCHQMITLEDTTAPMITNFPSDISVSGTGSNCQVPVTWNTPIAIDACGTVTMTQNYNSGDLFTTGTTIVQYTATDACGNVTVAIFNVTVSCAACTSAPIVSCPANYTACLGANTSPSFTGVGTAAAGANCTGMPFVTYTDATISNGPCAGALVLERTWVAYDPNSNLSTSCVQTISVGDNAQPTIQNLPANITLNGNGNNCAMTATWSAPTTSDNCSSVNLSSNHTSGSTFNEGTTTVTYTATDACGNNVSASFTVTVLCAGCNTVPSITCPTAFAACVGTSTAPTTTGNAAGNNNGANCTGFPSITYTDAILNTGPCAGAQVIERTWTATNLENNLNNSCVQTITLGDNSAPVFSSVPNNISVTGNGNNCQVPVTWALPVATDNCGAVTMSSTHTPGTSFTQGQTTVIYTAADNCGNAVSVSFIVSVQCVGCNTPPAITCPAAYTSCPGGSTLPSTTGYATATHNGANCNATPTLAYADHILSTGPCTGAKIIERTWTATDPSTGLSTSCVQSIILSDNTAPILTNIPADIYVSGNGSGCQVPVTWIAPSATDNCTVISNTCPYTSGASFPVGTTTVTYTATDNCGNQSTASFTVNVQCVGCNTPPAITCPAAYTSCPGGSTLPSTTGYATATHNGANCNATPSLAYADHILSTGPCTGAKIIERTWTATDPSTGLSTSCVQSIILEDTTAPVITNMPADIYVSGTGAGCQMAVTWVVPTATDNCTVLSNTCQYTSGAYFPSGTTTVTYTATDNCGNQSTASFTVNVTCGACIVPPSILCPTSYSACVNTDYTPATTGYATATSAASCTGTPVITYTDIVGPIAGSCPSAQIIERTWLATDPISGLSSSCNQTITLGDNTPPVITNIPQDITVTSSGPNCQESVTWNTLTITDNCGIDNTGSNYYSGDVFDEGVHLVSCYATDLCDNTTTVTFSVTVICEVCDTPPIITCPNDIVACPEGSLPITISGEPATAVGGEPVCNAPVINYTDNLVSEGPCVGQKLIERTWTAVDPYNAALSSSCVQTISLIDESAPLLTSCPVGMTVTGIISSGGGTGTGSGTGSGSGGFGSGLCIAVVTWDEPVVTDGCSTNVTLVAYNQDGDVVTSGDTFMGTTTVTYVATDACGNESTCSFDIIVTCDDDCLTSPTITCPDAVTACVAADIRPELMGEPTTSVGANCPDADVTYVDNLLSSGPCNGEAVIERVWTASITSHNLPVSTCTQMITIEDVTPSFTGCPADMTVATETDIVNWIAPVVIDPCANAAAIATHTPGITFPCGLTTVTYKMEDSCDNAIECSFNVTVECTNSSSFTNCPTDMVLACTGNGGAVADWLAPEFSSTCTVCTVGDVIPGFIYMGSYNGSQYYCSDTQASWPAAKQVCESFGGHLADVNSAGENGFLASQLTIQSAWIGLTDVNSEGNFEWCNGDPVSYTNWYPGQPNNYNGIQDYCEMLSTGEWNDQYNSYALEYIMEIPCTSVYQLAGPTPGSLLPTGTHTVTYGVNDPCGSTATCSFDITVEDCAIQTCSSGGIISTYSYINACNFGGLSNTSGNNGGYADYTNICETIEPGIVVPIQLHPGFGGGKPHTMYWTCWIDFNQDGDFDDDYEFVAYGAGSQMINGNITIPVGIPSGTCTMRLSCKLGGYATDPCEIFQYGETEDYCINVINGTFLTDTDEQMSTRSRVLDNAVELSEYAFESNINEAQETETNEALDLELNLNTKVELDQQADIAELQINIFPNPVANQMNIQISDITDIAGLGLFNQTGQLVRTLEIESEIRSDVSDLTAGMYFLRTMKNDGSVMTDKIIIMH